jgi:hypothetical protein
LDAFRVATGEKRELGKVLTPKIELTFTKCIEVFAEAIPAVLIQLLSIMDDKDDNSSENKNDNSNENRTSATAVWISLIISILSTGFISGSISYDWDTEPSNRQGMKTFYGYVPAKSSRRTIVFVTLVLFSSGMTTIRCFIISLLGLRGLKWPLAYIGGDLLLYLLVKIARDDLWYWLPIESRKLHLFVSILVRIITKVVTDFTSLVHLRHPQEVGGIYWAFSFLLTMGSLPVAIILTEHVDEAELGRKLAWVVVKSIIPATLIMFGIFLLAIDRTYAHTFCSSVTAKQNFVWRFRNSDEDDVKADVFTKTQRYWDPIEEEVKLWVQTKWFEWEAGENRLNKQLSTYNQ